MKTRAYVELVVATGRELAVPVSHGVQVAEGRLYSR
jgi:hypothetical protein